MNRDGSSFSGGRVFLVDDHPLVREWLASMISVEAGLEVCGQAGEAAAALAVVPEAKPDIMVVDLSMPRGSGLELLEDMHAQYPEVRLLVLSMHDESSVAERALRAGASGYAVKSEPGPAIIKAIRTVLQGKLYGSPNLTARLTQRMSSGMSQGAVSDILSDREMQIFRLRGEGMTTKRIAERLNVTVKTIGSYEARIKEKLGLDSGQALLREATIWCERQPRL